MNSKYSLAVIALTSTLAASGCQKEDDAHAPSSARDEVRPVAATTASAPMGAVPIGASPSIAAHHVERTAQPATTLGAASPSAIDSVTSGLRTDEARRDDRDAEAKFISVPTMKIEGDAEFEEVAEGVRIEIEVEHALPGQKGIHIHQTDNCSDIANKSMGEHFAPTTAKHGLPHAAQHHLGDLGNITIDKDGNGKLEITVAGANLKPNDPLSFLGRSVVIHESNDKGTGASGDSGKPIACAPIRAD